MSTVNSPPTQTCQWCTGVLLGTDQLKKCATHIICNNCTLNSLSCQSKCPCCWYTNGSYFITEKNICPVCCSNLKSDGEIAECKGGHKRCSKCSASGCSLCRFRGFRSWVNKTNLPADILRSVEACATWENKFEQIQENNSFNRQDSLMMDVDDNSISTMNSNQNQSSQNDNCTICLDNMDASGVTLPKCNHRFHRECIEKWFQSSGKQSCPICGFLYGISKGPQPSIGEMTINILPTPTPGFPIEQNGSTIQITYTIPSGVQGPQNSFPGQPYTGTVRRAYLPNNEEGKHVLQLLQRAFNDQHIFTIGRSSTTGQDNVVTWNDIHHKTSISGGPENFGYPDPTYISRVRQELSEKGYT